MDKPTLTKMRRTLIRNQQAFRCESRAVSGGATTTFTWDIASGLPVVLDDGNQYDYGAGLASMKQGGSWFYYLADGLGSTMAVVDSSGNSQKSYQYDVYGEVTGGSGSLANEFDFAGQQTDGTGLQYLRARYMDPETGTFLSRDPLASVGAWLGSPYGYADETPAVASDPTGLCPRFTPKRLCDVGSSIGEGASSAVGIAASATEDAWAGAKGLPLVGSHLPGVDALTNLSDLGIIVGAVTWTACRAQAYAVCFVGGAAYIAIWLATRDQLDENLRNGKIGLNEARCRNFTTTVPLPLPVTIGWIPAGACSLIGLAECPR